MCENHPKNLKYIFEFSRLRFKWWFYASKFYFLPFEKIAEIMLRHCWDNAETLSRHFWDIKETSLRHYWDITETLLRHFWDIAETLLRHCWDIAETLLRHNWDISETLLRHYWDINVEKMRLFDWFSNIVHIVGVCKKKQSTCWILKPDAKIA